MRNVRKYEKRRSFRGVTTGTYKALQRTSQNSYFRCQFGVPSTYSTPSVSRRRAPIATDICLEAFEAVVSTVHGMGIMGLNTFVVNTFAFPIVLSAGMRRGHMRPIIQLLGPSYTSLATTAPTHFRLPWCRSDGVRGSSSRPPSVSRFAKSTINRWTSQFAVNASSTFQRVRKSVEMKEPKDRIKNGKEYSHGRLSLESSSRRVKQTTGQKHENGSVHNTKSSEQATTPNKPSRN